MLSAHSVRGSSIAVTWLSMPAERKAPPATPSVGQSLRPNCKARALPAAAAMEPCLEGQRLPRVSCVTSHGEGGRRSAPPAPEQLSVSRNSGPDRGTGPERPFRRPSPPPTPWEAGTGQGSRPPPCLSVRRRPHAEGGEARGRRDVLAEAWVREPGPGSEEWGERETLVGSGQ